MEVKIPDISILPTKNALITVENKIPDVNSLVEKTYYNAKITKIEKKITDYNHHKYITTPEFKTLSPDASNARLSREKFVAKTDFDNSASNLHSKIAANKTKKKSIKNELKKIKTFYCS